MYIPILKASCMVAIAILVSLALLGVTILLAFIARQIKGGGGILTSCILCPLFEPLLACYCGEALIAEQCEVNNNAVLGWTDCVSDSDFIPLSSTLTNLQSYRKLYTVWPRNLRHTNQIVLKACCVRASLAVSLWNS